MRFADPLKRMLKALGMTEAQIDGDQKNDPIPLLGGKAYRDAATTLGTGWGRNMIDPDLWVRALEQDLLHHLLEKKNSRIVIDDVRYPNEAALLRRYRALTATVRRPEAETPFGPLASALCKLGLYGLVGIHSSEVFWRQYTSNFTVANTGTVQDLRAAGGQLLSLLPPGHLEKPYALAA